MKDNTSAWQEWAELARRRDTNPTEVAAEFLRANGFIVERSQTLSLPVTVASSGGFTHEGGYRLKLYTRVRIGDRLAQIDYSLDARDADMDTRAFTGAIATGFQKAIMQEIEPQIIFGVEQEIERAKERAK